jgi:hypothetical protein
MKTYNQSGIFKKNSYIYNKMWKKFRKTLIKNLLILLKLKNKII